MSEIKRRHWCVENSLHYVLDDLFREDRSNATVIKDNLALIRKFAFNLIQLGIHYDCPDYGPTEMMDKFSDNHDLLAKYIFFGIESF